MGMSAIAKYLFRRAIFVLTALVCATVIMFAISRMGEAAPSFLVRGACACQPNMKEVRASLADLARPLAVQYLDWGWDTARGDLRGDFVRTRFRPVADVIQETGWNTVKLILAGWLFAVVVGASLGVLSAVSRRARIWGFIGGIVAMFGRSMPAFLVCLALIGVFGPTRTWETVVYGRWSANDFVLPAIAAGLGAAAVYFRITRSATRDALDSDFIRFALDKGARMSAAARKRAVKNALVPTLAASSLMTAALINGAVVAEFVFGWPGLARAAVAEALDMPYRNPYGLLFASVFVFTAIYLIMNFAADALRAWADPRIRYA